MTNHPNRSKAKSPCHHLVNTANARKQIEAARAIIENHTELFCNMVVTSTLDNGGKLSSQYRDSQGFNIRGVEKVNGFRRELVISQSGYGLHGWYRITEADAALGHSIFHVGIGQTTEISDFAEALQMMLADRETELSKLREVL